MAHPHRKEAHDSSRSKMRSITGHAGGGHAHSESSHSKRADKHGVQHSFDAHTKSYSDAKPDGAKTKPRLDKFARGGPVNHGGHKSSKRGKKGDVNIAIVTGGHGRGAAPGMPGAGPASALGAGMPPGMPPPDMMPPPGGPPGLPPGMPPPPAGGGSPPFARGGRMTAGVDSGDGRLEQSRNMRKRR